MRLLLDTSACSALFRGHAEIRQLVQDADEVFLNPVILGELKAGFRRGTHLKQNEKLLADFADSSRVRVVAIDAQTSEHYAFILDFLRRSGTPIPINDVWIAATAMQHGFVVATADKHFERVPQILVAGLDREGQGPPRTGA